MLEFNGMIVIEVNTMDLLMDFDISNVIIIRLAAW